MQTYGQNRTPQQQMFNRFPQRFQQPQPVAQPAQGPVYADQSLNAPGNQPQQFQQPQYGRFGRGFMPQNRFGYDRQLDQLRGQGQYGQQYPQKQLKFMSDLMSGQQPVAVQPSAPAGGKGGSPTSNGPMPRMAEAGDGFGGGTGFDQHGGYGQQQMPIYNGPTQAQWDQMKSQPATGYEARPSLGGQQIPYSPSMDAGFGDPRNFNFGATPAPNTQLSSAGAAALGQPVAGQPNAPAGGKGGNPTAQLPPPPKQDGTPGSWSTYR
jgi:hypothetical protein